MAATEATIGKLSVIIGGDAKALDKMLAGAQGSINGFAARVGQIAGGVGLVKAVEAVTGALVNTVKQGLDTATTLGKLSESSGIASDQLSRLKYAADITGVSGDTLSKSVQSLNVGIADLAAGRGTDAANALEDMGIKARNADGSLKSSSQVLGEVAAKFASYKDGANKAALAQSLFGAGGEAMIPLLNKGRDGLDQLAGEADKFGLVLDGPTKAAVQSINTNLAKLDASKNGLALTIAGKLAPAFAQITGAMLNIKTNSNLVEQAANVMSGAMKYVATIGLTVVTVFGRVTSSIGDLFTAARQLGKGDFSGAWQTITSSAGKSVDAAKSLAEQVSEIWKPIPADAQAAGQAITDKVEAPARRATEAVKSALDRYLDSSAKRSAAMEAEAATIGLTADQQARLRVEAEADAILTANRIKLNDDLRAKIAAAGDAAAAAALKLQGASVTQEMLLPWEMRNQKLAQYRTLLEAGAMSYETFSRAAQKVQFPNFYGAALAATDLAMQVDNLTTNALGGLSSAITDVITGAQSAGEAFAAFGRQVIKWLIEMIVKAILFKIVMTAIGFAGGGPVGMSQSMSGTGLSLTSTGGLFDSGGFTGVGGKYEPAGVVHKGEVVFSQDDVAAWGGVGNVEALRLRRSPLPAFSAGGAVSPRVSVPQVAAPAMRSGGVVEVRGMRPKDIFNREGVRELLRSIEPVIGDGFKFKFS